MVNLQEFLNRQELNVLNNININYVLKDKPEGWGSSPVEFILDNFNKCSKDHELVVEGDDNIKVIGNGSSNTLIKAKVIIRNKLKQRDVAIRISSKPIPINPDNTKKNNSEILFTMGAFESGFGAKIYEIFQIQYDRKFVQVYVMKLYASDVKTLLRDPTNDDDMLMNVINNVNNIIIFMINNFDMLCLDIKFENFVAKYSHDYVEYIKMIDFGADFCRNLRDVDDVNNTPQYKEIYIILLTLLLYISAVSIYTENEHTKLKSAESNEEFLININAIFKNPIEQINEIKKYIDKCIKGSKFESIILRTLNHYYEHINYDIKMNFKSISELMRVINCRFVNKDNNNSNFGYAKVAMESTYQQPYQQQSYKTPVNNMITPDSISENLLKSFYKIPNFKSIFNKKYTPPTKINDVKDMFKDFDESIKNIKKTNKFGKSRKSIKRRKSRKSIKRRKSRKSIKRRKSRKSTKRRKSRKSTKRRKSN